MCCGQRLLNTMRSWSFPSIFSNVNSNVPYERLITSAPTWRSPTLLLKLTIAANIIIIIIIKIPCGRHFSMSSAAPNSGSRDPVCQERIYYHLCWVTVSRCQLILSTWACWKVSPHRSGFPLFAKFASIEPSLTGLPRPPSAPRPASRARWFSIFMGLGAKLIQILGTKYQMSFR